MTTALVAQIEALKAEVDEARHQCRLAQAGLEGYAAGVKMRNEEMAAARVTIKVLCSAQTDLQRVDTRMRRTPGTIRGLCTVRAGLKSRRGEGRHLGPVKCLRVRSRLFDGCCVGQEY